MDRADEEFEAYLLEILSEFQITVPELGTIKATAPPIVILTCNGTRDLSDALRRRCLYTYIDYPDAATELAILNVRNPGLDQKLGQQIIRFVQKLRAEELEKVPGIAETLDFAAALVGLGVGPRLDARARQHGLEGLAVALEDVHVHAERRRRHVAQQGAGGRGLRAQRARAGEERRREQARQRDQAHGGTMRRDYAIRRRSLGA